MGLNIRIPGRDEALQFGDDVEEIVFGRDAERCQVVFPADMTAVGREHCSLRRVLSEYRLVVDRDHLVLVNGKEGVEDQTLPAQCELQLGPGGPKCLVRTVSRTDMPPTVEQGRRMGQATRVQVTAAAAKRNRIVTFVVLLAVLIGAVVVWQSQKKDRERIDEIADRDERRAELLEKVEERVGTMGADLGEVRENLAAVGGEIGGLESTVSDMREQVQAVETRLEEATPRIEEALREARASVYMVVVRLPDGTERGGATAWVVGDGVMGTNAHVAEVFDQIPDGAVMTVRSSVPPHHTYEVESVTLHPGYDAFQKLWEHYMPVSGATREAAQQVKSGGACDVGLLHLKKPYDDLAPPLALAEGGVLEALDAGEPVGYVGFPVEGMAFHGTPVKKPSPQMQIGMITAVTDFFGAHRGPGDPEGVAHLIQHNCPAAGGASGSPMIDARGRVVAVLNAGNVVPFREGIRISTGVGVNFAQRVDLLGELLDDTAKDRHEARMPQWQEALKSLYEDGYLLVLEPTEKETLALVHENLERRTGLRQSFELELLAETEAEPVPHSEAQSTDTPIEIREAGTFVLVATARPVFGFELQADFDPGPGATGRADVSPRERWLRYAVVETTGRGTLHCNGVTDDGSGTVRFQLYRAVGTPMTGAALRERIVKKWLAWLVQSRSDDFTFEQVASGTASQQAPDAFAAGFADVPAGPILVVAVFPHETEGADIVVQNAADGSRIMQDVDPTAERYFCFVGFDIPAPTSLDVLAAGRPVTEAPVIHLFRALPAE